VGSTRAASDGLQLLQLLWGAHDKAVQLRTAYATELSKYGNGNLQLTMSSDSSRIFYNMTSLQLATDENSRRDFREALVRELEGGNLLREEKMYVLDGLRAGPGCLNNFSASISGASAGVRLPSGGAAG
jgi:hypothetical protein